MSGWTENFEDKLLNIRMNEYNKHQERSHSDNLLKLKTKPITFVVAILFLILFFVEMLLITIAILTPNIFSLNQVILASGSNLPVNLLWNITTAPTLSNVDYSLSTYAIAIIFIAIVLIVDLIYFIVIWKKEDSILILKNENKTLYNQMFYLLIGSVIVYLILFVLSLIAVSPINLPTNLLSFVDNFTSFGITYIVSNVSLIEITLVASGFGIFISIIQIIGFLTSIIWLIAFNFSINWSKFSKSKK